MKKYFYDILILVTCVIFGIASYAEASNSWHDVVLNGLYPYCLYFLGIDRNQL